MKTYFIIITASLALFTAGCASTSTQSGYIDDVYFNPKKDNNTKQLAQYSSSPNLSKEQEDAFKQGYAAALSQFEQQNASQSNEVTDFNAIQNQYAQILNDDSIGEIDTMLYFNEETGYWINGFNGSDMDRDYAERLMRFHGPFNGVPIGSPIYNDLAYSYNPDWNVYVDGNYMYAFPTWSNPYYNNYYTTPSWSVSVGVGWGYGYYGMGYYDPWYGYGYPYYGWGYPYYGYGYPYHGYGCGYPYYGCGGDGYYGYSEPRMYRPRGGHESGRSVNTPSSANNNSYTGRGASMRGTTSTNSLRQSPSSTAPRTVSTSRSGSVSTSTVAPSNNSSTLTTRRSYTPTYNQTQSTTAPSYNRPTTTSRGANTTTQPSTTTYKTTTPSTRGTTYKPSGTTNYQPSSSRTTSTNSSGASTPTYSTPRSSSSSNSYTPSSNSSSGSSSSRSYTPSSSPSSSGSSGGASRGGSSGAPSGGGGGGSRSSRR